MATSTTDTHVDLKSVVIAANPERKRVTASKHRVANQIPDNILHDPAIAAAIKQLPENYNFEIHKTIHKLREWSSKAVALQFPEGLLMYACTIADIIERFTGAETIIMGDVTYGACCVDDFTALALGADAMVHYGHSCLIPTYRTGGLNMLYVFVNIRIDVRHFVETLRNDFKPGSRIALVSTINFLAALQEARDKLSEYYQVTTPRSMPLSPGEILGCTSPRLSDTDCIVYLGDGQFHLESIMLHNPHIQAKRYDPYDKQNGYTEHKYDFEAKKKHRLDAISLATRARTVGLILGTLGRQGSPQVLDELKGKITAAGKEYVTVLLSEIFPDKLRLFQQVDVWVQVACPRLSIDWGHQFHQPLLTPYELSVALKNIEWKEDYFPMDYYAYDSLGPWTPNHPVHRDHPGSKPRRPHVKVISGTEKNAEKVEEKTAEEKQLNCTTDCDCRT